MTGRRGRTAGYSGDGVRLHREVQQTRDDYCLFQHAVQPRVLLPRGSRYSTSLAPFWYIVRQVMALKEGETP